MLARETAYKSLDFLLNFKIAKPYDSLLQYKIPEYSYLKASHTVYFTLSYFVSFFTMYEEVKTYSLSFSSFIITPLPVLVAYDVSMPKNVL